LPRKYRPPAKRRKNRTTNIPYEGEVSTVADGEWTAEAEAEAPVAVAVETEAPPVADPDPEQPRSRDVPRDRHISRDYSYVRGEIARITAIAAFLIAALIITAIFRN
jgi:hypothetical protein